MKLNETERYVTYYSSFYTYSGGAHGMASEYGATFDKKVGCYAAECFESKDVKALQPILRAGVESYFRGWYEKENDVESRVKEDMDGLSLENGIIPLPGMVFIFLQRVWCLSMDSMRLVLMLSECLPLLFLIRR